MAVTSRALACAALLWSAAAGASLFAQPAAEMVRDDWYLRESLAAIRDWEQVLARWEQETPEARRTPVFPVPEDGEAVRWPVPIPLMLLPARDRDLSVGVRLESGQVQVDRGDPPGAPTRESFALGADVPGYRHPGGGGKDQWYHHYERRFDRFTTFRPQPAAFALRIDAPLDLRRGPNTLRAEFLNVTARPISLAIELRLHLPDQSLPCGEATVPLAAGAAQTVELPLPLDRPGGGLAVLDIRQSDRAYWIPLFTHVETVAAVLESVGQILADTPDRAAADRLAALQARAEAWSAGGSPHAGAEWRALFEEASRLRDELLLGRIGFDTLLLLKRKPYFSEQPFMDAHHLFNRPGGGVYRLSPVRPDGRLTPVVDSLGEGVYRDVCLHWDARRLVFSFGNGSDHWDRPPSYHVYEVGVDGAGLRQLTSGPKNDCEPFYLPSGQIGFTSDRSEHYVMCGGDRHAPSLFVMEGDGSGVRQLSFNMFNDFNPSVLPDGRIIYGRWEYNERSVTSLHDPFTMNPDGTMVAPYYGNATIRPNVVMFPRAVPGSHKVMALFTAHHGQTHGSVGLIDVRRGIDGPSPLTLLTPGVPVTGEKAEDTQCGWFSDPAPLSETTWLCSYTPTVLPWLEWTWAIYVADRHGNLALVWRDADISCAEPVPMVRRPMPHVLPPATADTGATDAEAELVLADVYRGLPGVPRGTARYLRILEDVPRKSVPDGGVIVTSGTLIFTVKRVFGEVPVEPDGSAHFLVPANRNVYFEVLDQDGQEIQRMRSVVCLKPGERRSCIGCHEPRNTAPPDKTVAAAFRAPSRPEPLPWGTETLSYLRDIQPVLNAKCAGCHAYDRAQCGVILTDDLTDQFCVGYQELLPYLSVAISNRWDNPDDVLPRPPYTYGSKVSELTKLLQAGHHDVKLSGDQWRRLVTWIDSNGVYYDRYECEYQGQRRIFTGPLRESLDEVFKRRCAACHGQGDGREDTWWLSVNRRDVRQSRMLLAPLAPSAGGWGRCDGPVFADTRDADYQAMLSQLTSLAGTLAEHPRADLASLHDTEAERQALVLPPPPKGPPPAPDAEQEGWVYLSNLPWESATAGWSINQDRLPRRDRDASDEPLRLGSRRYPKGIGTHAPSEIVYRLDGRYARFCTVVGAAESGGSVAFQVFADDRCLVDTGVMRGLQGVRELDLPVSGVQRLRLVVTDAGDNYIADMANWAAARLLKAAHNPKE